MIILSAEDRVSHFFKIPHAWVTQWRNIFIFILWIGTIITIFQKLWPKTFHLAWKELVEINNFINSEFGSRKSQTVRVRMKKSVRWELACRYGTEPANIPFIMLVVSKTPRFETRHAFDFIFVARSLHAYAYIEFNSHIPWITYTYQCMHRQ